jgi:preprotein translocase subunit SecD
MNRRIRTRLLITVLLTLLSLYLFAGFPPSVSNMKERIRLGLDLSGGIHLVLEVVTDDAIRAETDQAIEYLRGRLQEQNIPVRQLTRTRNDAFLARVVDPGKDAALRDTVEKALPDWEMRRADDPQSGAYTIALQPNRVLALRSQAVDQAMSTIRNRIDALGVTEPVIQKHGGAGSYEILVQLPGVDDAARVRDLIGSPALLELKLVQAGPFANEVAARSGYGGVIPADLELLKSTGGEPAAEVYYLVHRVASVTGRDLKTAFVSRDENGRPAVGFNLSREGAQRFAQVTEQNIGKRLAIVLDGKVQSAPEIYTRVSDSGIIKGGPAGFSPTEARDLALILKSGALPASIKYLQEDKVSATLGAASVRAGMLAAAVAMVTVIAFMLLYYRLSGVNATVAMILNVVILLGAIAYFSVTLTLPGIAGITLTIGVGIDSNVLIFERVREELRSGKTAVAAVATSFNRVFITLVDTHLAALISAMFLFVFGTGPIKGFAVTLVIGLVSNMFTAVFVSRTLFEWVLARQRSGTTLSI